MRWSFRSSTSFFAVFALLALCAPPSVLAQRNSVQLRVGGFFPSADSEFWDNTASAFAFSSDDLNDVMLGATFIHPLGEVLALGFSADWYENERVTASLDYVDGSGLEILHDARLQVVPVMLDLRVYPGGREKVSRRGYVDNKTAAYLGGGIGAVFWQYDEIGDFVDLADEEIFFDVFEDDGVALAAHAVAGVEMAVGRDWSVLVEGRYLWAKDEPEKSFAGLGTIDLGGASVFVGASFHF